MITAGSTPDFFYGETFMPLYAAESLMEPLPQDIVDALHPSSLIYDNDGNPVAFTYKTNACVLLYNIDLLEQFGYTEEDVQGLTWAEWKEISDDITARGNGEVYGGGIPSFPHAGGSLRAGAFFKMNGTDLIVDGKANLDDPKVQETLQFIRDMNANIPLGVGDGNEEGPYHDTFKKEQRTVFHVDKGNVMPDDFDFRVGMTTLPVPEEGMTGQTILIGSVYLAVPKDAANKEVWHLPM